MHFELIALEMKHVKNTDWYKWLNNQKLTTYTKQGYFPNTKKIPIGKYKNKQENDLLLSQKDS